MATEGLLQWANSIRLTMATDPGRQLFRDQVQTHGFSFLDDYLDSIISNAKQDALIDLVKTPGRKRTAARKPKTGSKLKGGVVLSEDEEKRALPRRTGSSSIVQHSSSAQHLDPDFFMQSTQAATASTQVTPSVISSTSSTSVTNASNVVTEAHRTTQVEHNELSIIAEDDESAERSRLLSPIKEIQVETKGTTDQCVDASGSALLDGHQPEERPSCKPRDSANAPSAVQPSDDGRGASQGIGENYSADHDNKSLPITRNSAQQGCETTEEQHSAGESVLQRVNSRDNTEIVDMVVPLHDLDSAPPSPKDVSNPTPFPSLPAPAPFRKSMRVIAETSNAGDLGAVTPGAAITGKRTSWLQKARQAKALEIAGKKGTTSLASASLLQSSLTPSLAHNAKRKSTEAFNGLGDIDDGPLRKVAKTTEINASTSRNAHLPSGVAISLDSTTEKLAPTLPPEMQEADTGRLDEGGMLDLLKKTVEGLGAGTGRGAGKSLGVSMAANALAEARAAAEARIAERNLKEETVAMAHDSKPDIFGEVNEEKGATLEGQAFISEQKQTRKASKSVPDAVVPMATFDARLKEPEEVFQPNVASSVTKPVHGSDRRTGTTTPSSTPPLDRDVFILPSGPVFNKPPPVFKAPSKDWTSGTRKEEEIRKPSATNPALSPQGLQPSKQSTLESVGSELNVVDDSGTPAWMTGIQEASYTTAQMQSQNPNLCDEDDSWPLDEKLAEGVHWIYGDAKDDSTTWSSLPSQHNTVDLSEGVTQSQTGHDQEVAGRGDEATHIVDDAEVEHEIDVQDSGITDQDDPMPSNTKNTVRLVDQPRSQSQLSHSSSASSQQSQVGFFGQASKLISNMMGSAQKAKPDVKKVLQKAAVAAKKQQEESTRKATRLKEMENRRQLAIQRKAEEEKAKIVEKERKIKEENERRKREREELTEKRPLKPMTSRKEDDTAKKRKIETEKKAEVKNPINPAKPIIKSALKQPSALSSSAAYNSSFNVGAAPTPGVKPLEMKPVKSTTPLTESSKGKGKVPTKVTAMEEDLPPPSQIVQTQMAARAKAQLQAAKQVSEEPPVPSESIELPDINSEYSDSEDEDRPRTFDPPDWAQSPELRHALQQQSTINPDDIFGTIRPLRMEELFKTRTSRFRARTSSANWAGADRLTAEEEKEYARRMGFK